ncbi:MAG: LPS export ABC transporter ATP-binding protein [Gammaproteobacteria bacterium]|nr:LPS export ABC transporter ATP-binding protein [Gammaproteobacteria bacterium]
MSTAAAVPAANQLAARHIAKRFKARHVVRDVSLHVNSGEVVGLLGPNGAGKTTCFYMIVGLISCDKGEISLNDRDVTRHPMDGRARLGIGYLPQEASIFRKLSVADNIMAILQLTSGLDRMQRQQQLEQLLEEFHIGHLRDVQGMSLSGGERRRVEVARTLAMRPKFVLLDEPFAGVDPISVIDIQRIISYLRDKGIGVLITDHNVRETLGICDRAYIMNSGEVIAEGPPQAVLANEQVRTVYLGRDFHA